MKLTDEQINRMAAELLGECWHEPKPESVAVGLQMVPCLHCFEKVYADREIKRPDFIHDANAVRRLAVWLKWQDNFGYSRKFKQFIETELDLFESLYALAEPPKHITLAVLYAVGKITEQQAKEAMKDDD